MNVIAVKAITDVTPDVAFDYLMKLGFTTLVDQEVGADGGIYSDITQSTALGGLTYGVTTHEMTAAYAAIANGGIYTKPVLYSKVVDYDGNVIIDNTVPTTHVAMKPTTAWQLVEGMKSVVNAGTGGAARMTTGITCAGKTGTTSSNYDLWFCGMTPYYTSSIWMGYDMNENMGTSSAHKYMWRDINDKIVEVKALDTSAQFPSCPSGVGSRKVCRISNKAPGPDCPTFSDYCGTDVSMGSCEGHDFTEFCADSGCLATPMCQNKVKYVVEVDGKTKERTAVGAPKEWVLPNEGTDIPTCPLHPDDGSNMVTITATAGEGGSISPSVTVEKSSSVTFYITPYTGYTINDVSVDGVSIGPKSSYTFANVQANATIHVTFKKTSTDNGQQPTTNSTTSTSGTTAAPTSETTSAPTSETTAAPTSETTTTTEVAP